LHNSSVSNELRTYFEENGVNYKLLETEQEAHAVLDSFQA
jgi:hypothetical protein